MADTKVLELDELSDEKKEKFATLIGEYSKAQSMVKTYEKKKKEASNKLVDLITNEVGAKQSRIKGEHNGRELDVMVQPSRYQKCDEDAAKAENETAYKVWERVETIRKEHTQTIENWDNLYVQVIKND